MKRVLIFSLAYYPHVGGAEVAIKEITDRISDIQAAEAVSASPMMVLSPMTDRIGLVDYPHVPVFSSLAHCVDSLIAIR